MSRLSSKLRRIGGGLIVYYCQGCKKAHTVIVEGEEHPKWDWNGDVQKPTFRPSVLATFRDFTEKGWADWNAWIDSGHPEPAPEFEAQDIRCHTFITDGMVQFLNDCTHEFAGQTLPLPDLPDVKRVGEQP